MLSRDVCTAAVTSGRVDMRARLSAVGTCCRQWGYLLLNNTPAAGDVTAMREVEGGWTGLGFARLMDLHACVPRCWQDWTSS
jgi:hypothetical protein